MTPKRKLTIAKRFEKLDEIVERRMKGIASNKKEFSEKDMFDAMDYGWKQLEGRIPRQIYATIFNKNKTKNKK